jgi:hypothetical protein
MPVESAYYDTCVFLESLNTDHPECDACCRLLDPQHVRWKISICRELIDAESTIREFLDRFEIICAANGVTLSNVPVASARSLGRDHKNLKRSLRQLGLEKNDWTHLMAAIAASAQCLCTTDPDFLDPANKRTPRARKKQTRVRDAIEGDLDLDILLPSELLVA